MTADEILDIAADMFNELGLPFSYNADTSNGRIVILPSDEWDGEKPSEWMGVPVDWPSAPST